MKAQRRQWAVAGFLAGLVLSVNLGCNDNFLDQIFEERIQIQNPGVRLTPEEISVTMTDEVHPASATVTVGLNSRPNKTVTIKPTGGWPWYVIPENGPSIKLTPSNYQGLDVNLRILPFVDDFRLELIQFNPTQSDDPLFTGLEVETLPINISNLSVYISAQPELEPIPANGAVGVSLDQNPQLVIGTFYWMDIYCDTAPAGLEEGDDFIFVLNMNSATIEVQDEAGTLQSVTLSADCDSGELFLDNAFTFEGDYSEGTRYEFSFQIDYSVQPNAVLAGTLHSEWEITFEDDEELN